LEFITGDLAMPAAAPATSSGFAWIVGVGASVGLGAAIARRFAAGGLTAVVTGRTQAQLDTVVAEIEAAGSRAIAAVGDVTREADLQAILAKIEAEGTLEAAIFNAGNNRWKPTLEMETEFFEDLWRVGCLGGFIFGREAARPMVARGRGSLLFTGASASLRGKPQFTAFAAAKAGLRAVSQSMAREFGPKGVHVAHVVVDGVIDGDRINTRLPDLAKQKGPDGLLKIDAIADAFWYLHGQQRSAWSQEIDLRPFSESF
jgi:NAD(P)-dependent dehydrogenase (short-subunit alcohol dehydrogenase family)